MNAVVIEHAASTLVERPATAAAISPPGDSAALMRIIERAVLDPSFDVGRLTQLIDVKERWDREEARKAFAAAMAAFKRNPPKVIKDMHVAYKNSTGGMTEYDHESIGLACAEIIPALANVGISHSWQLAQTPTSVTVTCVLTHERGHSASTPFTAGSDTSGGKNTIQGWGSSIKYLERYTLLAAVGIAPMERDDDGRNSEPVDYITEHQAVDLQAKAEELGYHKDDFLDALGIDRLIELPASRHAAAIQLLNEKERSLPPATYPNAAFNANLPTWTELITSGKKTAERVIATVQSKHPLTDEQRKTILAIKPGVQK